VTSHPGRKVWLFHGHRSFSVELRMHIALI
jgi:hypothetical protein